MLRLRFALLALSAVLAVSAALAASTTAAKPAGK